MVHFLKINKKKHIRQQRSNFKLHYKTSNSNYDKNAVALSNFYYSRIEVYLATDVLEFVLCPLGNAM